METYVEFENLNKSWRGEVCIFGAGKIGTGMVFELIRTFGFHIDFYCDNYIPAGTQIRDGIRVKEVQYLYNHNEDVLVFLCVSSRYRAEIQIQLESHAVKNIVAIDNPIKFIGRIMESIDQADDATKKKYHAFYNDAEFLPLIYKEKMGCELHLEHPVTFNEKLQWLKLHDRNPLYTRLVDKYQVKQYVADKLGAEYVIPTLGVYENFGEIAFEKLPQQFVMKCTHDSGSVVICDNRDTFDRQKVREKLERSLNVNYYWYCREWPYKNVKPQIVIEKMMKDKVPLIDYKFYCFSGEPKFLYISAGLENQATALISFYNLDLSEAPFQRNDFKHFDKMPRMPVHYDQMIELSKILSKGIPFVRVDFYEISGQVYFSEMTFTPGGGMMQFDPPQYDEIVGNDIDLKDFRRR